MLFKWCKWALKNFQTNHKYKQTDKHIDRHATIHRALIYCESFLEVEGNIIMNDAETSINSTFMRMNKILIDSQSPVSGKVGVEEDQRVANIYYYY